MSEKIKVVKAAIDVNEEGELCNCVVYRADADGLLSEVHEHAMNGEDGDRLYLEVGEMTKDEFDALPEHQGW